MDPRTPQLICRLPSLPGRQRHKEVTEYAKHTRHSVLKYLAILRWKAAVDFTLYQPVESSPPGASGAASFPTPYSNAESADSPSYSNKGKGRATDNDEADGRLVVRGRLMDAKRIEQFMQHQNAQHDATIRHVEHSAKVVESLR